MSRSSGRGQTEPLAALVAVVVVGLGLGLFASTLEVATDRPDGRGLADPTMDRVERVVAPGGVARPGRLRAGRAAGPEGSTTNVSLFVEGDRWAVGPSPPATAAVSTARIGVHTGPARVEPGLLVVRVWP